MKNAIMLLTVLLSVANAEEIAIIGVDSKGKEKIVNIKDDQLREDIVKVMNYVSNDVVSKVNEVSSNSQWSLKKFSVGLGLEGEIGLGPWNVGAGIKQRLFYSR